MATKEKEGRRFTWPARLALLVAVGIGAYILIVVVLASSGSGVSKQQAEADLAFKDTIISVDALGGDPQKLYADTLDYIKAVRKRRGALGATAARQHLADLANTLQGQCAECVSALNREIAAER